MAELELRRLAEGLQATCLAAGLTVATAESCTGGRVSDALTDVAGSSGYVRGGVIAYADEAKRALLGVPSGILAQHGAVSAQVARAMAAGARERLHVDLAVAITGSAGPSGATPGKPVGLTYVAVADPEGVEIRRFAWSGDREANKQASARAAIELLGERATQVAADDHPERRAAPYPPAPDKGGRRRRPCGAGRGIARRRGLGGRRLTDRRPRDRHTWRNDRGSRALAGRHGGIDGWGVLLRRGLRVRCPGASQRA